MQIRSPQERSRVNALIDDAEDQLQKLIGVPELLPENIAPVSATLHQLSAILRRNDPDYFDDFGGV